MIRRLRLVNFRRHQDTELIFEDDDQLVLIDGLNGSGKTTILEALLYALYGEGRHGRRKLDALIRRGNASIEGMTVELDLNIGDSEYCIVRRRDNRSSSATLHANGHALMEGSAQVTAEVTKILGMDAAGFRLAVIAQQKELDGLADLTPAKRGATVARLLRLDAITRAHADARTTYNLQRKIVESLGPLGDVDQFQEALAGAQHVHAGLTDALEQARTAALGIEVDLVATAGVDIAYQEAVTAAARAEGAASAAQDTVTRLEQALQRVVVPEPVPGPEHTVSEIDALLRELDMAIARGEADHEAASDLDVIRADATTFSERLETITTRMGSIDPQRWPKIETEAAALLASVGAEREELISERDEVRAAYGGAQAAVAAAQTALTQLSEVGAVCETCAQPVAESHRASQAARYDDQLAHASARVAELFTQGVSLAAQIADLEASMETTRMELNRVLDERQEHARLMSEAADVRQRLETYQLRLTRTQREPVDLEELYTAKGHLTLQRSLAEQAKDVELTRLAMQARRADLEHDAARAREVAEHARRAFENACVDASLQASFDQRAQRKVELEGELDLVNRLTGDVMVAVERVQSAQQALARHGDELARRRSHETTALVASQAATLLDDVATRMSTQLRPALQGAVSALLSHMSEGRFDAVRITSDYEVTVRDDGDFRALADLSGGECDLVALALRLALAGVVADRHGGGGPGFLILDECFGSQDPGRREAILTALRTLRSSYGQILLISHVGGLEDAADRVVHVGRSMSEGLAVATLS